MIAPVVSSIVDTAVTSVVGNDGLNYVYYNGQVVTYNGEPVVV